PVAFAPSSSPRCGTGVTCARNVQAASGVDGVRPPPPPTLPRSRGREIIAESLGRHFPFPRLRGEAGLGARCRSGRNDPGCPPARRGAQCAESRPACPLPPRAGGGRAGGEVPPRAECSGLSACPPPPPSPARGGGGIAESLGRLFPFPRLRGKAGMGARCRSG